MINDIQFLQFLFGHGKAYPFGPDIDPLLCPFELNRTLDPPFPERTDFPFKMRDLGLYSVVFLNRTE